MKTYHVKTGTIVEEWSEDYIDEETDEVLTRDMRAEYTMSIHERINDRFIKDIVWSLTKFRKGSRLGEDIKLVF